MKEEIAVMWIMHTAKGTFDFGYKAGDDPPLFDKPPVWMADLKRKWDNPRDPVTFEFTLANEKYIQDAFNYLYNGPVEGIDYPPTESE